MHFYWQNWVINREIGHFIDAQSHQAFAKIDKNQHLMHSESEPRIKLNQEQSMNLNSQANAISAKIILEIDKDEKIQKILSVVTGLSLDSRDEKFDSSSLDDLIDKINSAMQQNTSIDKVIISNWLFFNHCKWVTSFE